MAIDTYECSFCGMTHHNNTFTCPYRYGGPGAPPLALIHWEKQFNLNLAAAQKCPPLSLVTGIAPEIEEAAKKHAQGFYLSGYEPEPPTDKLELQYDPRPPEWKGMPEYRIWCFAWPIVRRLIKPAVYMGTFLAAGYGFYELSQVEWDDFVQFVRANTILWITLGVIATIVLVLWRLTVYASACKKCGNTGPWHITEKVPNQTRKWRCSHCGDTSQVYYESDGSDPW